MCSTFSGGFKLNLRYIYISRDDTSKNSLDLERAPGARSIAEEKSGVTILVIELHWSQGSEHFRSPAVFLGILPQWRGRQRIIIFNSKPGLWSSHTLPREHGIRGHDVVSPPDFFCSGAN